MNRPTTPPNSPQLVVMFEAQRVAAVQRAAQHLDKKIKLNDKPTVRPASR